MKDYITAEELENHVGHDIKIEKTSNLRNRVGVVCYTCNYMLFEKRCNEESTN